MEGRPMPGQGRDAGQGPEVDLLLFEAGGRRFGAEATRIRRIARRDPDLPACATLGGRSDRALVIRCAGGESQVVIDRLVGFERAPFGALHAVPAFARALVPAALQGFRVDERGEILPLIDLEALVKEDAAP